MSKEVVAEVIALIELGLIAPEDIVKCLRKANSEPEKALAEQPRAFGTLAQQQEPVAWTNWRELVGARHYRTPGWEMYTDKRNPDDVAIYTSPQRTWVGLTDEEILEVLCIWPDADDDPDDYMEDIREARAIEAKLKEKNA